MDALGKQGLDYLLLDDTGALFQGDDLSNQGRIVLENLRNTNIFLISKGLDPEKGRKLLEEYKKPILLQTNALPDKDMLALIKKTGSAIGLIMGMHENVGSYFRKLDEAKRMIGTRCLAIVVEESLWSEAGKKQAIKLIGEMLKAGYEKEDMASLFSGSFLRAVEKVKN